MSDIAKEWRVIWGSRVWDSILRRHQGVDRQVFVYAGKDYARPIERAGFHQATFHEPLAKMQIGQRLRWLREQLDGIDEACGACGHCARCQAEGPDAEAYGDERSP